MKNEGLQNSRGQPYKQTNKLYTDLNFPKFLFLKNENNHTSANSVSVLYSSKGGGTNQPNNGSHTLICSAAFNWGKGSNLFLHVFKVSIIVSHISSGKIIKCESKKKESSAACWPGALSSVTACGSHPSRDCLLCFSSSCSDCFVWRPQ